MSQKKFSLTIGSWYFTPSLRFTILTLITITLLVYLGCWQLHRAKQKKILQKTIQERAHMAPINITELQNPTILNDRYTPVIVEGVFLNQYTFLLDNQMFEHKPGFRVLTAMQVPDLSRWVLIDRGWIDLGSSRAELPKLKPIYGLRKLTGQIDNISTGMVLQRDQAEQNKKWPILIQSMDYNFMEQQLQHMIYNFTIRLNTDSDLAFRFPQTNAPIDPRKNIIYAVQWFCFAILLLLYYIFIQTKRRTRDD